VSLCAILALALAGAAAPVARSANVEGGNSFSELSQKAQEPTQTQTQTTATTASTQSTSSTNSNTLILLASAAAVVVLIAIAFVIARDARRVAPAGDAQLPDAGSDRHSAARLRKRREKAKAARRQRRRNR
jgi:predicted PurR-regulated permease PerM